MARLAGYVVEHPSVYLCAAPIVALTALSTTPSFFPLVFLLTILQLHVHTFLPRRKISHGVAQVLLLSGAAAITHLRPSLQALSGGPTLSIIVLSCISAVTAVVALLTIAASIYANRVAKTPWSRLTLFPALWASVWGAVTSISPVGQLITWSSVLGLGPYSWIRPIFGQWGIDWLVAAWAVVGAYSIGNWLVGEAETEDAAEQEQIISFASSDSTPQVNKPARQAGQSSHPTSRHVWLLTGVLTALAIPSYFMSELPLPATSTLSNTALGVGCALPEPRRSGVIVDAPTLEDFISASHTLQSSADIILWPEGALRFETTSQKQVALDQIMSSMQDRKLYGVSFEDFSLEDSPGNSEKVKVRRNGFVLLEKQGIVLEYYKRMLVPIAESFSLTASSDPPSIYTLALERPKSWRSKTSWSANGTRPIPITASICLDFSSSHSFETLESRPALILAPARTWHIGVGYAMWEQARARAEELGSLVLWCDGGKGGVSGVAGGGMHEPVQVGQGSWSKRVGIKWPYDEGRTLFSLGGGYAALITAWGIVGVGAIMEMGMPALISGADRGRVMILGRVRDISEIVRNWRLRNNRNEERPLLE